MAVEVEGKTIVLTGTLSAMTRKQATAKLEAIGATVASSVSAKTDILFAGPDAGSKLTRAEKLGVPVYDEAALLAALDVEVPAPVARTAAPATAPAEVRQEIADGEVLYLQGSASKPYELKNTGGVYSCTCPAWRNQSLAIDRRTCKHLKKVRGTQAEVARVGADFTSTRTPSSGTTQRPALLLAHKWEAHMDPAGWWMSEKLDGVRAYWNGTTFISRLGNEFLAPDWFIADFPETPLDGELWMERGAFQTTVSVVRRQDRSQHWENIRFVIFDAPTHGGVFEERLEFIHLAFAKGLLQFAHALAHQRCEGMAHLAAELERVERLGGEGLMLREPQSKYVGSRSTSLLKVKSFFDAEAKVIGHTDGAGRHKGRVGALELVMPNGTRFSCGTGLSDAERDDPPAIGTIVTYRYQELTDGGVPRFPSYIGVRADAEWPDDGVSVPVKTDTVPTEAAAIDVTTMRHDTLDGKVIKLCSGDETWQVGLYGSQFIVTLNTEEHALAEVNRLIAAKKAEGYRDTSKGDDD